MYPTSATSPLWTGPGAARGPGHRRVAAQEIGYAGPGTGITEGTRSGLRIYIADGLRRPRPSYASAECGC